MAGCSSAATNRATRLECVELEGGVTVVARPLGRVPISGHDECAPVRVAELNGDREVIESQLQKLRRAEAAPVVPAETAKASRG
jgi:hypothetical protein